MACGASSQPGRGDAYDDPEVAFASCRAQRSYAPSAVESRATSVDPRTRKARQDAHGPRPRGIVEMSDTSSDDGFDGDESARVVIAQPTAPHHVPAEGVPVAAASTSGDAPLVSMLVGDSDGSDEGMQNRLAGRSHHLGDPSSVTPGHSLTPYGVSLPHSTVGADISIARVSLSLAPTSVSDNHLWNLSRSRSPVPPIRIPDRYNFALGTTPEQRDVSRQEFGCEGLAEAPALRLHDDNDGNNNVNDSSDSEMPSVELNRQRPPAPACATAAATPQSSPPSSILAVAA